MKLTLGILFVFLLSGFHNANAQCAAHQYDTACGTTQITYIPPCGGDETNNGYTITSIPYTPDAFAGTNCFTTAYDDGYSGCIPIGFTFCFYGQSYTQVDVSSNCYLSFDCSNSLGTYSTWPISSGCPIPCATAPVTSANKAAILCPWQDLYVLANNNPLTVVTYQLLGCAPFRRFVVSYNDDDYFSCTTTHTKCQAILYESTNVIEIYIHDKPICSGWNGGLACEGIQNSTGTVGQAVAGRNCTQWSVTTPEGYQFCPIQTVAPVVTWSGPNIVGSNVGNTITVNATGAADYIASVTYTCSGGTSHDTVSVVINGAQPILSMTPVACTGNNGTAWATPTGGIAPFTYLWSPSGQTNQTATGLGVGLYTVSVTDSSGCVSVDTITVTSVNNLSATGGVTNVLCNGTNTGQAWATVTAGTPPFTYAWTPSAQTGQTATNLPAGIYTVTITDPNSCNVAIIDTITEPPLLVASTVPTSPPPCSVGVLASITANGVGGTGAYTYLWSPSGGNAAVANNLATGTYTVTITDANGCTSTSSASVIDPIPLVITSSQNDSICLGQSASINVTVSGGTTPYNIVWNPGGAVGSTLTVVPTVTTSYTATVTDANGCVIVGNPITVTVVPAPVIAFTANPLDGCIPLNVQFNDQTTSLLPIVNRQWNFGDGSAYSDSTAPLYVYNIAGTFTVTLTETSSSNCTSSLTDTNMITAYPLPKARFLITPEIAVLLDNDINFTDQSSGALYFNYYFGDGSSSSVKNPHHQYADTGTYYVTQLVVNKWGCLDSVSGTVIIKPEFTFYIPSAFTPGNDGMNDVFQGYGVGIREYALDIFDRWGEKLFSTTELNTGWDGTVNGSIVKSDIYVYHIKIQDGDFVTHEYTGRFTLLR